MTGFIHAGETDDRSAGPDFISAVKSDGQGKRNRTAAEEKAQPDTEEMLGAMAGSEVQPAGGSRELQGILGRAHFAGGGLMG